MVRDRHKMVSKPFSSSGLVDQSAYNSKTHMPVFDQAKSSGQKYILDESSDGTSRRNNENNEYTESTLDLIYNLNEGKKQYVTADDDKFKAFNITGSNFHTPPSQYFQDLDKIKYLDPEIAVDEPFEVTSPNSVAKDRSIKQDSLRKEIINITGKVPQYMLNKKLKHFNRVEKIHDPTSQLYFNPATSIFNGCVHIPEILADIDVQILYSKLDFEPPWIKNQSYWDTEFESRYEALMRSTKWPPLKVLLVPVVHVDTYSSVPFHPLFTDIIITNVVSKLQLYKNLTFTWNEVAQFSRWWERASKIDRGAVLRLIQEGRFEITTGGWVEIEETTSYIFGMLHQLTEGHQWLKNNLNYLPEVAWLTKSVTHSPTVPYILSASGVGNLVITKVHYSIEHYFATKQYSDFIWIQNWESNRYENNASDDFNGVRVARHGDYSVVTHYLQFNSDDFGACGPVTELCFEEFDFESSNKSINVHNIKEKSELLLEQYSKTGSLSPHNVIIVPLGGPYRYQEENSFKKLYNNYIKIADFINLNQDIYKATLQFGTPKDYFAQISSIHTNYPTIKGEFYNYIDKKSSSPVYEIAFFRTSSFLKLLFRYLESNLRSAEILFSFAHSLNVFKRYNARKIFKRLIVIRENTASLQDRNIVGGKLSSDFLQFIHSEILRTIKDCWQLQEAVASLLSSKPGTSKIYLEKYIYRDGNLISPHRDIVIGDKLYIFNPLNQQRVEVVEFISRSSNMKIIDYNNRDIEVQINPMFQYKLQHVTISGEFYKIIFVATFPPLSFKLFKIDNCQGTINLISSVYCDKCEVETTENKSPPIFQLQSLEKGDIEIENDRHHVIIDQKTGFIKIVTDKTTGERKAVFVDFGSITSSHKNTPIHAFNVKNMNHKVTTIISGQVTTEVTTMYKNNLQHRIKIFHSTNGLLKYILQIETQLGHELLSDLTETHMFLSIQTEIKNGIHPEMVVDNNGFQYTHHFVNLSRNIESNMYSMSSLAFIQDKMSRLTIITDHIQGVTSLNEGQIMILLDKVQQDSEDKMDFKPMTHTHILLLENLIDTEMSPNANLQLPSMDATYIANALNHPVDVYLINHSVRNLCYYASLSLLKTSLPCNVNMLNFRMLSKNYNDNEVHNTALLTLQRHSYSCDTQHPNKISCDRYTQFNLSQIFHNIHEVYKTNLVGTKRGPLTDSFNLSNFKASELMTFIVHF